MSKSKKNQNRARRLNASKRKASQRKAISVLSRSLALAVSFTGYGAYRRRADAAQIPCPVTAFVDVYGADQYLSGRL